MHLDDALIAYPDNRQAIHEDVKKMRIVAGELKSRTVEAVKGMETRPTQDHIKESIFNRIGPYFDGGEMLDLFAGSGNIGFESLSRGITSCVLIDKAYNAIATINRNAKALGVYERCRILKLDYSQGLHLLSKEGKAFSLVYVDPPYALKVYDKIMEYLSENEMVCEEGLVVLESAKEDIFLENYGDLVRIHEKIYGITKVSIYRRQAV